MWHFENGGPLKQLGADLLSTPRMQQRDSFTTIDFQMNHHSNHNFQFPSKHKQDHQNSKEVIMKLEPAPFQI